MTSAAGYTAGDAIYDLGRLRARIERLFGDDPALELLDRVQTFLAQSPALHAEARRQFLATPEWMIPKLRHDDDPDDDPDERHLGDHPPLVLGTPEPFMVPFTATQAVPVRHLDCGCIADARPLIAWPPEPYDGMIFQRDDCIIHALKAAALTDTAAECDGFEATIISARNLESPDGRHWLSDTTPRADVAERMADELEHHIAKAEADTVRQAEQFIQAGTEEYGTG